MSPFLLKYLICYWKKSDEHFAYEIVALKSLTTEDKKNYKLGIYGS